jgi:hypothetical protein
MEEVSNRVPTSKELTALCSLKLATTRAVYILLLLFPLDYATKEDQDNKKGLELNGVQQVLVSADDSNLTVAKVITYQRKNIRRNYVQYNT